jgi:hypothetical protein
MRGKSVLISLGWLLLNLGNLAKGASSKRGGLEYKIYFCFTLEKSC